MAARIGLIFQHKNIGQTFTHKRHYRRIIGGNPIRQRGQAGCRCGLRAAIFNVQRHTSRWRVAGCAVDDRGICHFYRIEFYTQRRFQRIFPALFNLDRLPETRCVIQLIFRQPHRQTIVVVQACLLILQRQQGGLDTCQLSSGITDGIDGYFSPGFKLVQSLFGIGELLFGLQQYLLRFSAFGLHLVERVCIGYHQIHVFGGEAILAMFQLREDFQRIRFACLLNCLSLLRGANFVFAGANHIGRLTQLFFKRRNVVAHNLGTLAGLADTVDAARQFTMPAIEFICRRFSIGFDFGNLHSEGCDLCGQTAPIVAEVVDLLL